RVFRRGMMGGERVGFGLAAFLRWVSRLLVAVLSAVILPASAIEPVLSSTSATRRRELPHLTVDETLKLSMEKPATFKTVVGTEPVAFTTTWEPPVVV